MFLRNERLFQYPLCASTCVSAVTLMLVFQLMVAAIWHEDSCLGHVYNPCFYTDRMAGPEPQLPRHTSVCSCSFALCPSILRWVLDIGIPLVVFNTLDKCCKHISIELKLVFIKCCHSNSLTWVRVVAQWLTLVCLRPCIWLPALQAKQNKKYHLN